MTSNRQHLIGIKQAIRYEWMEKTANLLLAGLGQKAIRHELHEYLTSKKGDGSEGPRSVQTRTFVVNNLMNIWISPEQSLMSFRDIAADFLQNYPRESLIGHWSMVSAAYPFWFNVARHTGRLLALQDQITQSQITSRLKEQYGDRETIARYARFVIRSFVAWGVLRDADSKGCYRRELATRKTTVSSVTLLFESALHILPSDKSSLTSMTSNPAFFPFNIPVLTAAEIVQRSDRFDIQRSGISDDLLSLHNGQR